MKSSPLSNSPNYYAGGLAEIVATPSALTFSFLRHWFNPQHSLGQALDLLHLPHQSPSISILEFYQGQLMVDLNQEQKVLYDHTIFRYQPQTQIQQPPRLVINWRQCLSPLALMNTIRIIWVQSQWIGQPQKTIQLAEEFVNLIPPPSSVTELSQIDQLLTEKVWPYVIAIDILTEFYNQLLKKETKDQFLAINTYLSSQLALKDWFFLSQTDQYPVKTHHLDFDAYISRYGIRADDDYELTCPRWHEITPVIKQRINQSHSHTLSTPVKPQLSPQVQAYVSAAIDLQQLRARAKHQTLFFIDQLRQILIDLLPSDQLALTTRDELLAHQHPHRFPPHSPPDSSRPTHSNFL
ncbi:MAG: hypothetical protein ACD_40C00108G0001, partial [uncultured bacterium]